MSSLQVSDLKAILFDLDGTVVDSGLDFDQMRADLNFPVGAPILEELATLTDEKEIAKANEIIHRHELIGAEGSTLMPGFEKIYAHLKENNIPTGLLTRNSAEVTELTLKKHDISFDIVLTRDCCLPKPDPEGLNIMKDKFQINDFEAIYIGDYQFDLITAKRANLFSGLYSPEITHDFQDEADILIKDYHDFLDLLK